MRVQRAKGAAVTIAGAILTAAQRIELLERENQLLADQRTGLERATREYAQTHLAIADAIGVDGVTVSSRELIAAVRSVVKERNELRASEGQAVA